ncbi:unnamed protein product [Lampetra fluviatilis]
MVSAVPLAKGSHGATSDPTKFLAPSALPWPSAAFSASVCTQTLGKSQLTEPHSPALADWEEACACEDPIDGRPQRDCHLAK